MTLPNFLVIGAGRSGTTSLHHYLSQHPDVFVPRVKAPSYFYCLDEPAELTVNRHLTTRSYFVRDAGEYEALFDAWAGEHAVGEVSPAYLASTRVPVRILESLGPVRLVAVVRNPVERVQARYIARRRDGLEPAQDLASALVADRLGRRDPDDTAGTYLASGFVSGVLRAYSEMFGADQLQVHLFEDLRDDPSEVMRRVFDFIGVDPHAAVDLSAHHNRSGGEIRNPVVRAMWTGSSGLRTRLRPLIPSRVRDMAFSAVTRSLVPVALDHGTRDELEQLYRPEVDELERLLGRDLSHWRTGSAGRRISS
jgi:hypothetical protein